ncbi:transporter substrate-binding domain-containing protein [Gordonia jinhuaensis]|uniref:Amino acid ABC transporter, substrate-binding protein n=1 Tax=Gordonia jinhuaensis TaxID=1517702 RepID=A0A916WXD5_9ACTN|nr:transporter substrate-binding domain-containing protein [Gordonia jinhuaensis]GGB37973.1 putative amino acid ABC transporter, substrate-binding protein [Gordonia jinhuaensis]
MSIAMVTAATVMGTAAGCSEGDSAAAPASNADGTTAVTVGAVSNGAATETTISVPQVAAIRAELPKEVLDGGALTIGIGALPAGSAPLAFVGTDQKTLTGSEPDLGRLVAGVLGLRAEITNATWDNLFVGIDSGRSDVGFSNVTVTEARKDKYDFASYRKDNLAFEVLESSSWNFDGNPDSLAGKTVSVSSGTNQEKILLEWRQQLQAKGKTFTVKYFPDSSAVALALQSGKIDTYFGPNPSIAYHIRQTASTPKPTRDAGTYSGAGQTLQGLIAATTKKGSGLVKPLADALNYLISNGQYSKWLAAWNLSNESVTSSQINPPGLPRTNS